MKKKVLALSAAVLLAFTAAACGGSGNNNDGGVAPVNSTGDTPSPSNSDGGNSGSGATTGDIERPDKIVALMNTAFGSMLEESSWASFNAHYQEMTGIELVMIKPLHQSYYEQMALMFTSNEIPDMMEIGSVQYPTYASNGALWDMTAAWENSDLRASGVVTERYVDALKIDGVLYGFPLAKGNGTITYVRGDWLENLGLEAPTNYEEFLNMLRAFTFDDPDGNGVNDTYGLTAPGVVNAETPYAIYLPEFYQDAVPDFYQTESGEWVDGMTQPEMLEALRRLSGAYAEGLIDREIATNNTAASRDKYYAGEVGVFNYWAGRWNVTMDNNLQASNPEGWSKPIPAIQETKYIERPPTALAITNAAANPEGIFHYLISMTSDGGDGELFFSRGIEGEHFIRNEDGTFELVPDFENPNIEFAKTWFDAELSFTTFEDPVDLDDRIINSLEMFEANSVVAPVPRVSDVISIHLPDLLTVKNSAIAKAVTGAVTPEEAIAEYETLAARDIAAILEDLNR